MYMLQLINALDRFDSMSRRTLPSPAVCRSVIECCKDTVAVFGKAVGVLALQLKVLATHDDVRYLRQMLLVLYGATAEISHAWHAMIPHIDAVKPLLREHRKPPKSHLAHSPTARSPSGAEPIPATPTSQPFLSGYSHAVTSPRSPAQGAGAVGVGRTRTARRHAGSFSSKDVEIGKKLPSYDIPQTPTLRAGLRQPVVAASPIIQQAQAGPSSARSVIGEHSRQGSQTSLKPSSSGQSSPSIPLKAPVLEPPPNSRTLVDKEALDAMRVAVEAAPAVWEMMDEILGEGQDTMVDVRDTLARAKTVTNRLRENISAVQTGHPADRKTLREDAHVFVKVSAQYYPLSPHDSSAHSSSPDRRSIVQFYQDLRRCPCCVPRSTR